MAKTDRLDELMTADELAGYLGLSLQTLYNWKLRGEGPPAYKVGGRLRFRRSEVKAWLRDQRDDGFRY